MIRDEELNRLIKYAQGLGLSVHFKPYVKGSNVGGGWAIDGSEINVYVGPNEPKINKILYLIHEISHHKGFIENGRTIDPRIVEALNDEDEGRRNRKRIYMDEVEDTKHWEQIYNDCNLQFPIRKLYEERDFDIWTYKRYYEDGKFPTQKEKREKSKELKKKYSKT